MNVELVRTNRDDPNFYNLIGPFFGSRQVAKDLGMPIWNDPGREWIVALSNCVPIACSSIEFLKTPGKAVMKSGWVHPDWRGQGVYNRMFEERLRIAKERGVKRIIATVTDKSYNTHIRHGFEQIGIKGKYKIMRKELE
ncbi:GNAT family N-acetyltransferase [Ferviditalea candida]|uniref:GNAT family N-acetyltransferase n=1 Tax=Ferviditalea candida TaxID=3108399 RepID=A0ABU5ZPF9_9BACL|nr:GNAT family N-acetyltransferase [Paenibacillaceae bacterium T2]